MPSPDFRLIRAIHKQPVDRTPIWLMRQAGRYLPEYRKVREQQGGFLNMCQQPEVAANITLQPLQRFDLDAVIIFADILLIPDAMGLGLHFTPGEGPAFDTAANSEQVINNLPVDGVAEKLSYVFDAIDIVNNECKTKVPVIGFCGSPWTVATYMVEGKSSKTFSKIKAMMYQNPALLESLLDKLATVSIQYLTAQVQAGASVLQVFDTWGGVLTKSTYKQFSLKFMRKIVDGLKSQTQTKDIPVVLFSKNCGQWLEDIVQTNCDVVGLDWTCDLQQAKKIVGDKVTLQGNLDPAVLYADEDVIRQHVKQILDAVGTGGGHVFNLGHGIYPDIPYESVNILVNALKEMSPAYHIAKD